MSQGHRADSAIGQAQLRRLRKYNHSIFDPLWNCRDKVQRKERRVRAYRWLAEAMGIPLEECHFGYMNEGRLLEAASVIARAPVDQHGFLDTG